MKTLGRVGRTSAAMAATAALLMGAGGLAAWADDLIINDVQMGGGTFGITLAQGGSPVSLPVYINGTGQDGGPQGQGGNCNASSASPITVTLAGVPSGVNVSPNSLQFTQCGPGATQSLSATAAGTAVPADHTVIASASGGVGTTNADSTVFRVTAEQPSNSAPAVASDNANVTVVEGQHATNTGTWSDANAGDTVSLSASVGSITKSGTNAAGTWSWSYDTTDGPDKSQTVTVTATDDKGRSATTTFDLTVDNVAPSVEASIDAEINCRTNATLDWSFTDPGTDADWTVDVDWGDTTSSTATVGATDPKSGTLNHAYEAPDNYSATVTVTDDDGASGANNDNSIVVRQTYSVTFLKPFDASTPGSHVINKAKAVRTVPVKVQVYDDCAQRALADGDTAPNVKLSKATVPSGATTDGIELYSDAGSSNSNTDLFRWSTDGFWIYNLDTKALNLTVGQGYRVDVNVGATLATEDEWGLLATVK